MIQAGIDAATKIAPNTYLILLLALLLAKEVLAMIFKGIAFLRGYANGKETERKDETKHLPCLMNPMFTGPWDAHKQEAHDTKVIADRLDGNMSKLLEESLLQTVETKAQTSEIKKQTGVLEKIERNGSSKKQ